jgi:hypothetical protein
MPVTLSSKAESESIVTGKLIVRGLQKLFLMGSTYGQTQFPKQFFRHKQKKIPIAGFRSGKRQKGSEYQEKIICLKFFQPQ